MDLRAALHARNVRWYVLVIRDAQFELDLLAQRASAGIVHHILASSQYRVFGLSEN